MAAAPPGSAKHIAAAPLEVREEVEAAQPEPGKAEDLLGEVAAQPTSAPDAAVASTKLWAEGDLVRPEPATKEQRNGSSGVFQERLPAHTAVGSPEPGTDEEAIEREPTAKEERERKVAIAELRVREILTEQAGTCDVLRREMLDELSVACAMFESETWQAPTATAIVEDGRDHVQDMLRGSGDASQVEAAILRAEATGIPLRRTTVFTLMERLRTEEELEGVWHCLASALQEADRLAVAFWLEEAGEHNLQIPEEAYEALEALREEESARLQRWECENDLAAAAAALRDEGDVEGLRRLVVEAMATGIDPSAASAALASLQAMPVAARRRMASVRSEVSPAFSAASSPTWTAMDWRSPPSMAAGRVSSACPTPSGAPASYGPLAGNGASPPLSPLLPPSAAATGALSPMGAPRFLGGCGTPGCNCGGEAEGDAGGMRERLYVNSPNGQTHIFGMYVLQQGEVANGMPLWRQLGGERWLYSDTHGRWTIGGARARELHFEGSNGFVYCGVPHKGQMPDEVGQGRWYRHDEVDKQWCRDEAISVSVEFEDEVLGARASKRKRDGGRGAAAAEMREQKKQLQAQQQQERQAARSRRGLARGGRDLYMNFGSKPGEASPEPAPHPAAQAAAAHGAPGAGGPSAASPTSAPAAAPAATTCRQRPAATASQHAGAAASPPRELPPRPARPAPPRASIIARLTRSKALKCLGLAGLVHPTAEEIRRAYRRAAMRWHPDRRQNHGREEDAKRRFQTVRDAFEFLQADLQPLRLLM